MFLQKYDNVENVDLKEEIWSKIDISMVDGNKEIILYDRPIILTSDIILFNDEYAGMLLYTDGIDNSLIVLAISYETTIGDNLFNEMYYSNLSKLKQLVDENIRIFYGTPVSVREKMFGDPREVIHYGGVMLW